MAGRKLGGDADEGDFEIGEGTAVKLRLKQGAELLSRKQPGSAP